MTSFNSIVVSAGVLVDSDGRVLIAQRPEGKDMTGLWEFPGGKVHENETPEEALIREMYEELGIDLCPWCFSPLTFVSHRYETFHLLMLIYLCRTWEGIAEAKEHTALKWVRPKDLKDYPMPPADAPLIGLLRDRL